MQSVWLIIKLSYETNQWNHQTQQNTISIQLTHNANNSNN